VALPMSVLSFASSAEARRRAIEMIEAEDLDIVRLWAGGMEVIEIRRPAPPKPASSATSAAHERADRMLALRRQGLTTRAIADEFAVSKGRADELVATAARRAEMFKTQPNRAVLSNRALQAIRQLVDEAEEDVAERDARLPSRVAALTRREIGSVPNIGAGTVAEIEAWLWERGLSLA